MVTQHIFWVVASCHIAAGYIQAAPPNYEDHIRPLFENACFNCHNPDKQKGDLDLTTYSSAMRGGSGGKFAESGEGADSKIYGVITHTVKPKMPPKGDKLEKKEADLIRAWIDGGLLENKSGKPQKKKKPVFVLSAAPSAVKPEGPTPMPEHVLLEPVVTSSRASAVADMATSPWGPLLAITGQRQVVLYNTDDMEMIGILPFNEGQPEVLSFHPSGKYLLAGGGVGGKSGTTITWDINTGNILLRAGQDYDAVLAASLRLDLKGVSLGGAGKRVKLWDTEVDEQFVSIKKHTDWVTQLAYSPDGVLLASGGRGGDLYIWEADTGNAFHNLRGHKGPITGMAWRADSNLLATVSEDGEMIIWEMNNGKQVKKQRAHKGGVLSVDWSKDGHLVSSGRDKKVRIWKSDFKSLKELPVFDEMITEVSFSYDGKRVFAAKWSGVISVWDVASAEKIGTIAANPPTIVSRIETLLQKVGPSQDQVVSSKKISQVEFAKLNEARDLLAKIEQEHRDAVAKSEDMMTNQGKIVARIKEVSDEGEELNKKRQQVQHSLIKMRELNNKHNAAVAVLRREHQQTEKESRKLLDSEKRLLDTEKKIQKAIKQKPDDQKLAAQLVQVQSKLINHRESLRKHLKFAESKKLAFYDVSKGQEKPGDQLALAELAWKDISEKHTVCHAERRNLNDSRNVLNKKISEQKRIVGNLGKDIKVAREQLAKVEEDQRAAEDQHNVTIEKHEKLSARIKHWQAAIINADVIKLDQETTKLKSAQQESMDAFTLAAAEMEKIEVPAMLAAKKEQLLKLRYEIDQRAPVLLNKQLLMSEKKRTYYQMIKR